MKKSKLILLPGLGEQLEFFKKNITTKPKSILVIGSSSEIPAVELSKSFNANVQIIVEDYESLLSSKVILNNISNVEVKMMNYESTDFSNGQFDLIYAQASISLINRNKIVKEIKRILKTNGYLCVGEITVFEKEVPRFVTDIFDSTNQLPLYVNDLDKYYLDRKFKIHGKKNLTQTLKGFYSESAAMLKNTKEDLPENEKSYYKKLLNQISHESNVYLKLGGDKYLGFYALILQKGEN